VIAGFGDELFRDGGPVRGGFRFVADAGRHVEGEAGARKRQVREEEPHLLAGDVLHLVGAGAETLDEVRLAAGSGAAAPLRRAGEVGFGLGVWRAAGACDTVPTRIQ
jgi:hypothetical protein